MLAVPRLLPPDTLLGRTPDRLPALPAAPRQRDRVGVDAAAFVEHRALRRVA
jgi:hypothetical protein